jgi:hypothetical protein
VSTKIYILSCVHILKERDLLEDRGVNGIGSEWMLGRLTGVCVEWIHLAHDGGRWGGRCECGDEPAGSGSIQLDWLAYISLKINISVIETTHLPEDHQCSLGGGAPHSLVTFGLRCPLNSKAYKQGYEPG